jgi:tetratricopeptide (TPR) repeat protein
MTASFEPAEWKSMLPLSQRLAEAHPDKAEAVYCYGVCLLRCQLASGGSTELERAQSLLEQAIRLEPRFVEAHLELGKVYMAEKEYQRAVKEFRETLRLDPESLAARYRLAQAYRSLNQVQSAQQELVGYEEQYHYDKGSAYLARSAPDPALHEFRLGIEKYPASPRLQFGLGLAYSALRQYPAAADALVRALEIDPSYPVYSAWSSTAGSLSPADWEKVLPRLEQLAKTRPRNAQVLYCYGVALLRSHLTRGGATDLKRAQSLLEQAIGLEPRFVEAHLELGNVYMAEEDNQRAVKELREAAQLAPEASTVHYQLAQAYQSAGQPIAADQELARYRELVVGSPTKAAEAGTIVKQGVLQTLGEREEQQPEP